MKLIETVYAQAGQQAAAEAQNFVNSVNEVILYPLIALLSGVAFLVFLFGCAEFVFGAASDQARAQGKKHVLWGIIGLVVMLSSWTILSIAAGTFGLDQQLNCADNPNAGGCESAFTIPTAGSGPVPVSTTGGAGGSGGSAGSAGSGGGNAGAGGENTNVVGGPNGR